MGLLAYLGPCGVDDRTLNRIEVALEELVSNVVRHAHGVTYVESMPTVAKVK